MGIELICDMCGAPMCAFTNRFDGKRVCLTCRTIDRQGTVDQKVYRALGALTAGHRGYIPAGSNRYMDAGMASRLAAKTKALIRHDRILRGEE